MTMKSGKGRSNSGDISASKIDRSRIIRSDDSEGDENASVGRKVPILLREPGGKSDMYDSESDTNMEDVDGINESASQLRAS